LFIWLREKVVFLHVVLRRWSHLRQVTLQELAFHGLLGALGDYLGCRLVVDLVIVDSSELLGGALLDGVGLQAVHVIVRRFFRLPDSTLTLSSVFMPN